MKVDLIDIGFGNISSLKNWLDHSNIRSRAISSVKEIKSDVLVLPGVGSAGPYMKKLKKLSFDKAIKQHLKEKKKLIGICLGFQILYQVSEEDGDTNCLGLLKGSVKRIGNDKSHNGWEKFYFRKEMVKKKSIGQSGLTAKRVVDGRVFYNHEYGVINQEKSCLDLKVSKALKDYSALVIKDNIIGIQFHPEKSQITGKELLEVLI